MLFLGEWCRPYDKKHDWLKLDIKMSERLPSGPERTLQTYNYLNLLFDSLLAELTELLNSHHGETHSQRYWHIILGHWLHRAIAIVYNRYDSISQLNSASVSKTITLQSDHYSLSTNDSLDFIYASNDAEWNHVLYKKTIKYIGGIFCEDSEQSVQGRFTRKSIFKSPQNNSIAKTFLRSAVKVAFPLMSRETDSFIIGSYFPPTTEALLCLSLGQVPQKWNSPEIAVTPPDPHLRDRIKLSANSTDKFENLLRDLLIELMPTCFLEGYKQVALQAKNLPWPSRPRLIFTSNNFDTDEIFKLWTAKKVEQGVPYFVGQHGNNYGTLLGSGTRPEYLTSDRFFTWGWGNAESNKVPAFIFKRKNNRWRRNFNPHGGLLLIEVSRPNRLEFMDTDQSFAKYQEDQFRFVEALTEPPKGELTVRLHAEWRKMGWFEDLRWADRHPEIKLENGHVSIEQMIRNSRLCVHSYDSTGILETLALNIPTICFWSHGTDHLLDEAKPLYNILATARILFFTPEAAASHINSVWSDVPAWWNSATVQQARQDFTRQYARLSNEPVKEMKQILLKQLELFENKTRK